MGRARGQNAGMALGFETAYGTPPTTGNRRMPFVSSNLGAEQGLIESDLLGRGRAPYDPTYDVVVNDGDVVVPLDTRFFGQWLRLLLGAPVTTGTEQAGYVHVFTSGMAALPSASIEIQHPDRPAFSTSYGARANTLQIQMQRSGLASATLGLIAKGETVPSTTTNAGALVEYGSIQRFAMASGSVKIDGAVIGEVVSAQLGFSNGLEKDETIRSDSEINDVDPGMPSATLSLVTKFTDITLYTRAVSKDPVAVQLSWSVGARTLEIEIPRLFLPRPKKPITGPAGIQATFAGIGATTTGQPLMIARLTNDVASY
ncbi:hypothetical protein ASE75_06035 [Sphingomonas sp. Leaf17]|uniref:phage tail tube protein n=1 Tax=Sphingomonas sp. Leaf17 TaxID=1735683 RepID=UPI0006F3BEA7|nr:phage tail tube protein [Sphingomonas sp. Leaf17]KQM65788.1 hypothetical protein ASE75_06035 [Sphingomonas sp. Leaf17]